MFYPMIDGGRLVELEGDCTETELARAIGALTSTNPFSLARIELEASILKDGFVPLQKTWQADPYSLNGNRNHLNG